MRGAWAKPESEYLGAGTRRETRARRLAELQRQGELLRAAVDDARRSAKAAADARERLEGLLTTFPPSDAVRATASRAEALAGVQ